MQNQFFFKLILSVLGILCFSSFGLSQNYFKAAVDSDKYFNQKIDRFSNQDVLIVDSSLEPLETGEETGEIAMSRLDECGNEVWSQAHVFDEGYLEFADFKISENDEIFVFGSYYKGLQERIFLAKFDGTTGANLNFILLNTGTVDHFSYSIDIQDGQILIYGLVFDFNTAKLGFVAAFNENLTYLFGKQFSPFESTGNAIIAADNSFLGWSGEYIVKLDTNGDLVWAKEIEISADIFLVGGPFEVAGGYIFESNRNEQSFFFKINNQGDLLWKSDQFKANGYGVALSSLMDGNIICTYNYPMGNISELCQMKLSPDGNLFDQRSMLFDHTFNTGTLYQSLDENNNLTIAGNSNPISLGAVDAKDFLFQLSLDPLDENCWAWEYFEETFINNVNLNLSPYTIDIEEMNMTLESSTTLDIASLTLPINELCGEPVGSTLMQRDTLLPCDENWEVTLPGIDFEWVDNYPGNQRVFTDPGTYSARKMSCTNPVTVEYTFSKSNCGCQVYIPNVFSPNFDGVNDYLEFFSDCIVDKVEMNIFDRWGEKVFQSTGPGQFWDGTFKQKDMPIGVYVVLVKYEFTDLDGSVQQRFVTQDVTVVR